MAACCWKTHMSHGWCFSLGFDSFHVCKVCQRGFMLVNLCMSAWVSKFRRVCQQGFTHRLWQSNCTMLILPAPSSEFQNLSELGFPGAIILIKVRYVGFSFWLLLAFHSLSTLLQRWFTLFLSQSGSRIKLKKWMMKNWIRLEISFAKKWRHKPQHNPPHQLGGFQTL